MGRLRIAMAAAAGVLLLNPGAAAQEPPSPGPDGPPALWVRDGRPVLRLGDGRFTLQPMARLDADFGGFRDQPRYWNDQPPRFLDQDRPGVPPNGINLRRLRLGIRGTILEHLTYSFAWSFGTAPGSQWEPTKHSRLFELQLAYTGLGCATLRAGAFTPRHTIEYAIPSFELTFLERPAIIHLATSLASGNSRLGLGAEARGEGWFAAAYATDGSTLALNDGRQRGLVGRANVAALRTEAASLLIGVNAAVQLHGGLSGGPEAIRLRDHPELRLDPLRLLDTRSIAADSGTAIGPEFAALLGPLYLQSECQWIRIDAKDGAGARNFRGYYLTAALPLHGPPRRHDAERGAFVRPRFAPMDPGIGHWGWIELAARWSYVSLDDGPTRGGRQGIAAVALNWYPAERLRLSLQYSTGAVKLDGPDRAFQAVAGRLGIAW